MKLQEEPQRLFSRSGLIPTAEVEYCCGKSSSWTPWSSFHANISQSWAIQQDTQPWVECWQRPVFVRLLSCPRLRLSPNEPLSLISPRPSTSWDGFPSLSLWWKLSCSVFGHSKWVGMMKSPCYPQCLKTFERHTQSSLPQTHPSMLLYQGSLCHISTASQVLWCFWICLRRHSLLVHAWLQWLSSHHHCCFKNKGSADQVPVHSSFGVKWC